MLRNTFHKAISKLGSYLSSWFDKNTLKVNVPVSKKFLKEELSLPSGILHWSGVFSEPTVSCTELCTVRTFSTNTNLVRTPLGVV